MTVSMPQPRFLDRRQVGKLSFLAAGAQGRLFDVPGLQLPDIRGPLVYKEYRSPPSAGARGLLEGMVSLRREIKPPTLQLFDARAAWPLRVVVDRGMVAGIVMRKVPPSYTHMFPRRSDGSRVSALRNSEHLMVSAADNRAADIPVATLRQRRRLCLELALILGMLHRRGVVYGDLNPNNVLYHLDPPAPGLMLVDCDGARRTGTAGPMQQLQYLNWFPPESGPQNIRTDEYKYGLFVLRVLLSRAGGSISIDPAELGSLLDPAGQTLLRRALLGQPERRPDMSTWFRYWDRLRTTPVSQRPH